MAGTPLPDVLEQAELSPRAELPYRAAALVGLVNHIGLMTLFAVFGIWPMVAFNVLSIATFAFAFVLIGRNRVRLGLALAIGEVIVHQILAVYFTGWTPGFQYYLPVVVALPLMLPEVPPRRQIVAASIPALVYVGLIFTHDPAPPNPFPSAVADILGHINLLVAFSIPWVFVYYFRHGAELAEAALARAAQRAEQLLYGILPPSVVVRLRRGEVVADSLDEVSILFCDIVGFTTMAKQKSPEELVEMLDGIFAEFDDLVAERGLEKIKTIGDAYMVAAGVPEPIDDHAERLADLALAIQASPHQGLSLRLGLHCGRVVAGVIGKSKFAYDIWGDAVNTAARMESHGQADRIHISAEMAAALGEDFVVSPRGPVEIKGKGSMQTYWLEGRRT